MKAPQRSRSLQIYVKPGIREDDVLIGVWDACARFDRPQDVFRNMLRRGMVAMVESGEMPRAVIDACGLDAIVDTIIERRNRKAGRVRTEREAPAPHYPQGYAPQPPYPVYHPPAPQPVYAPQSYQHPHEQAPWPPQQLRPVDAEAPYERSATEPQRQQAPPHEVETDRSQRFADKAPLETPIPPEPPPRPKRDDAGAKPGQVRKGLGELM